MRGLLERLAPAVCLAAALALPAAAAAAVRDGWGRVFDPNPVNTLRNSELRDNADADGPEFAGAYVLKQLRGLSYSEGAGRYTLRGPYVAVTDSLESPLLFPALRGFIPSQSGSFVYGRRPDQFEHVMVYYHIDTNQRYIQALGFGSVDSMPGILNKRPIKVDPHGLAGRSLAGAGKATSRYVPNPVGAGYLVFGTGGVDDAEDADVILHEYARAIQDYQASSVDARNPAPGKYLGTTGEAAAMGEGFADYWAASSTYEQSVANGFDPACVGEWNAAPGCMDRVDTAKVYADRTGNAQADGQIWSAALWDLFHETGDRGATDTIILQSHFLTPAAPTFADGVQALLDADEQTYEGAHQAQICSAMAHRGLPVGGCAFMVKVTWDNPMVDLDVHLRRPGGDPEPGWNNPTDCFSQHPNPDWGILWDPSDDPLLKVDCRYLSDPGYPSDPRCHEEQIVLKRFTVPGNYDVYVHYFDRDWIATSITTTATVEVYQAGQLLFSGSRLLTNANNDRDEGDFWKAYTVVISQ